jgi:hypothetical protein
VARTCVWSMRIMVVALGLTCFRMEFTWILSC